jgi:hypothetical protein
MWGGLGPRKRGARRRRTPNASTPMLHLSMGLRVCWRVLVRSRRAALTPLKLEESAERSVGAPPGWRRGGQVSRTFLWTVRGHRGHRWDVVQVNRVARCAQRPRVYPRGCTLLNGGSQEGVVGGGENACRYSMLFHRFDRTGTAAGGGRRPRGRRRAASQPPRPRRLLVLRAWVKMRDARLQATGAARCRNQFLRPRPPWGGRRY